MTPRRRVLAAASAAVAALGLTGCEKPLPIVTVQSGTTVEVAEARSWCFGEAPGEKCVQGEQAATELEAKPGQIVSVDVSKEVADRGWVLRQEVAGSPQQSGAYEPRDDHYFTITMPPVPVQLTITALDGNKKADGTYDTTQETGSWVFVVKPKA